VPKKPGIGILSVYQEEQKGCFKNPEWILIKGNDPGQTVRVRPKEKERNGQKEEHCKQYI
jgi:hypothetical protein